MITQPNPNLGDKIEIHIGGQRYNSQVSEVLSKDDFIILGPIKYSKEVNVLPESEIKIFFTLEDKGRCWFIANVIKVFNKNIYKIHVKRKSKIVKLQEREFYRLRKIIDVKIINNSGYEIKALAEDISGKGFKIITKDSLRLGEVITLKFNINDYNMELKGKVVRVQINDDIKKNEYGIYFCSIDNDSRDKIIKFIFEEQRKLRKKGLR